MPWAWPGTEGVNMTIMTEATCGLRTWGLLLGEGSVGSGAGGSTLAHSVTCCVPWEASFSSFHSSFSHTDSRVELGLEAFRLLTVLSLPSRYEASLCFCVFII